MLTTFANLRPSGLQAEIDTLIARLAELRTRPIAARCYDDEPGDLRALADLAKDAARAMDPLLQRVAYEAGMTSMSGASEYVGIVSDTVADELLPVIGARADRIEDDRAVEPQSAVDRREHSTLNHWQLGLPR